MIEATRISPQPTGAALSAAWFAAAQRRRVLVFGTLALLVSLVGAWLVLQLQIMSAVWLFVLLLFLAILWRPQVGLVVAFILICFFENGGEDLIMQPGHYLYAGLGNYIGAGGILPSPLELLLFVTLLVWFLQGVARRRFDFQGGQFQGLMLLFIGALLYGTLRGVVGRAPLNQLAWELRFVATLPICYFLATNTIRTRRDVRLILALALVVCTLFGLAGLYRRIGLFDAGLMNSTIEFAFGHESVIFWGFIILMVVVQIAFGAPGWQRLLGAVSLPVAGFALLASERRAGQMGVIIGFVVVSMVLYFAKRRAFMLMCLPAIIAFSVYLPIFWNNTSTLGQPARAIRSLYQPDPRDASSNLYRQMEKINIHATLRASTLFGVGFGRPFLILVQMVDVSYWPLWTHQPHNNILWIWLKVGPAGFVIFWTLVGGAIMRAAYIAKTRPEREVRTVAVTTLVALVITLVYCYVDLALTGPRLPVFLGTLIGVLGVVERIFAPEGTLNGVTPPALPGA